MYQRKVGKLKIIPRLLLVCEGKVTEKIYFEGVRRQYGIPKDLIRLETGKGTPKTLVDLAVDLKLENQRLCRRDAGLRFDQVWCVFDRDSFTCIPAAKQKAKAHGVKIAFTNPCFELFLLLHFIDCTADLHRSKLRSILKRNHLPGYDKSFNYAVLQPHYEVAKERAETINARSELTGSIESPPFCSVPELIEQMTPDAKRLAKWTGTR